MREERKEWFSEWFDSPYYHILYKDRDEQEAEAFIDNLIKHLGLNSKSNVLDIPCGKGRHAIYLNKKGFRVTGADLSAESIRYASQFSNERLKFFVHDMREDFAFDEFDVLLNLFTSFGYFNAEENSKTLSCFSNAMKKDGRLVIDFMNASKVLRELVAEERKIVDGIEFCISRKAENNFIVKNISFDVEGRKQQHQEIVSAISMDDFIKYFDFAGLSVENIFGDYNLKPFDEENSERMIFILKK